MGDSIGKIIGGIFAVIAFIGLLVFLLGFIALFNMDAHMTNFEFANDIFNFFNCGKDCIGNVMGYSLVVLVLSGAIGGLFLKNS
ncbi:MAG: hypothetical protein MUO97_07365 [Dehalococcoidia bacterium]|nr:hypothetical protein [Dehalococcoidia bacterium]